jgi:5-methylcytosine-specific restriction protein A
VPARRPWEAAVPYHPQSRCTSCHRLHDGRGRCDACRRTSDRARGTRTARGYGNTGHADRFRPGVLARDPRCVCTDDGHGHDGRQCGKPSTVADHHPLSRRQLVVRGLDPDDPRGGRGCCAACHNSSTARLYRGTR